METAEELFHACDLDNDGFIDREELKYAISKRLGKELDDAALDSLLTAMDSDGDGKISFDDFVLQFDTLAGGLPDDDLDITPVDQPEPAMDPAEFEEKMRWIFTFFDKDGDGVVTIDELKLLLNEIKDKNNLESADDEIENFINQLDQEDRGHISFPQFFRAIQKIIDPNEDPLPVYSPGERPKRPRSASWVAPESIVNMIRKKTDGNFAEANEVSQIEQYKRTIEQLKGESDQVLARNDMLQKNLREVKGNNEKLQEENEQLKDKLQQSKRSIKQNEKLQKQNRALEANLEVLKTEVAKMKEQSRDLQRACTKLKLEKDSLNDELYIKRRDLLETEEKLIELQQSAAQIGPALRKSLSSGEVPLASELEKLQEENQLLKTTLEREQRKVSQMVKLLNEDNAQLKNQLKEDSALIESSNQIIQKLRQALEEHTANSFSSDPGYKSSLLSELEHDVVVRLTPRISESDDELARSMNGPTSPAGHMLRTSLSRGNIAGQLNGSASSPNNSGIFSPPSAPVSPVVPQSPSGATRAAMNNSSDTAIFSADDRSDVSEELEAEGGKKTGETGGKLQTSESHRLRRVNSEERRAADQIGMYEEMDELEEQLVALREKYAALEKDYLKLQTENVSLKAVPRKLSFGSSTPPTDLPTTSPISIPTVSESTAAASSPNTALTSSPKPIPRLSLPNTPTSSPKLTHASQPSNLKTTPTLDTTNNDAELKQAQEDIVKLKDELALVNEELNSAQQKIREFSETQEAMRKKHEADLEAERNRLLTEKEQWQSSTEESTKKQQEKHQADLEAERARLLAEREQWKSSTEESTKNQQEKHQADLEAERARLLAEREQWKSTSEESTKKQLEKLQADLEAERTRLLTEQSSSDESTKKQLEKLKADLDAERARILAEREQWQSSSEEGTKKQQEKHAADLEAERTRFLAEREQWEKSSQEDSKKQQEKHAAELEAERSRFQAEREQLQKAQSSAEAVTTTKLETEPVEHQQLEALRANLESERADFETERTKLQIENTKLKTDYANFDTEMTKLQTENTKLQTAYATLEAERKNFDAEHTKLQTDYARLEAERANFETENSKLKSDTARVEEMTSKMDEEIESLKNANVVAEATLLKEASDARAMASQLRAAVAQMEAANAEKASISQQLSAAHAQTETLTQRLQSAERELQALRNAPTSPRSLSNSSSSVPPTYQQGGGGTPRMKKVRDTGRVELNDSLNLNAQQDMESQPLMDEAAEKKDSCCSCCTIS